MDMLRFHFKRGLKIRSGLKELILQKRLANGNLYFETDTGDPWSISESEFYEKYIKKEWVVLEAGLGDGKGIYEATPRDLQTFSEKKQKRALLKHVYIEEILKTGNFVSTPALLNIKIKKIAELIQDMNPPSSISIYRWYRKYSVGKSVVSLVDMDEYKGRRPSIDSAVLEIIQGVVDTIYLSRQKNPAKEVYDKTCKEVKRLNSARSPENQLKAPSRAKIYRYISEMDAYMVTCARLGKDEANKQFEGVLGEHEIERLLQRWEIDHSPLDIILVIYLNGKVYTVGRPWITVVIDKYSRMVMGFYICFHTPSAQSVLMCLKHAILPKDEFVSQFGDIKSNWVAHGIPETLVCDNGMDLHATAVAKVCNELGIQLQFCPAKSPKYKGTIERFFRTLNQGLIHSLPGTVFSNPKHRGDYKSEAMACIDLETLTHLITKWITDIYHQTLHRGIKSTPLSKWQSGLEMRSPIEMPADPEQLSVIMGIPAKRKLFHYGIEINKLYYNSQVLQALRRKFGKNLSMDIKYYETDLGYIHAYDPIHKEYLQVKAVKFKYAHGLSLDQHEIICRLEKESNALDTIDTYDRREELKELICQSQKSKKMAERKKSQVIRGSDSNIPMGNKKRSNDRVKEYSSSVARSYDPRLLEAEIPKFNVSKSLAVNVHDKTGMQS